MASAVWRLIDRSASQRNSTASANTPRISANLAMNVASSVSRPASSTALPMSRVEATVRPTNTNWPNMNHATRGRSAARWRSTKRRTLSGVVWVRAGGGSADIGLSFTPETIPGAQSIRYRKYLGNSSAKPQASTADRGSGDQAADRCRRGKGRLKGFRQPVRQAQRLIDGVAAMRQRQDDPLRVIAAAVAVVATAAEDHGRSACRDQGVFRSDGGAELEIGEVSQVLAGKFLAKLLRELRAVDPIEQVSVR